MISANTKELLQAAQQLAAQADVIEQAGVQIELQLRAQRERRRILFFFGRAARDIDSLEKQRILLVGKLRKQSLYLRECAKRYKAVQSWTIAKFDRLG